MSVPEMTREVALGLFGTVDWASFARVGLVSTEAVATLERAEAGPLDAALRDEPRARAYASALLAVVGDVSDPAAQCVLPVPPPTARPFRQLPCARA